MLIYYNGERGDLFVTKSLSCVLQFTCLSGPISPEMLNI